jgi:2-polyprenyl-3-methyl-5-hydroxy-6-metoxy-1,4-benzoquinol methylase
VRSLLNTVRSALLLGFCNASELERRTLDYYAKESPFDEAEYLAEGLQGWEVDAICAHFPPEGRILVAAAGGGRETRALAAMGYSPAAFDPSEHLLDRLRAGGGWKHEVVRADASEVPVFEDAFDAVIIGWGGYTHIPEASRRGEFLQALAKQMKPGAPILMSFFLRRDGGWRPRICVFLANCLRRVVGLKAAVETGDTMTNRFEHRFTAEEVSSELAAAGLRLIEFQPKPFPHAIARNSDS